MRYYCRSSLLLQPALQLLYISAMVPLFVCAIRSYQDMVSLQDMAQDVEILQTLKILIKVYSAVLTLVTNSSQGIGANSVQEVGPTKIQKPEECYKPVTVATSI